MPLGVDRPLVVLRRVNDRTGNEGTGETPLTLRLMRLIDEQFLETPFFGSRQMTRWLRRQGDTVSRKRVRRLMRRLRVHALFQRPRTSQPHPAHRIYPYLLRDLPITRPNHVWCTDVTDIPLQRGFLYLVAVMDWASRTVLSWRLSNTLDARFCVEALHAALERDGPPEIFNSDQGSQFTSVDFTDVLGMTRWLARSLAISAEVEDRSSSGPGRQGPLDGQSCSSSGYGPGDLTQRAHGGGHSHLDGRQGPLDGQRSSSGYGAHSSTNASTCPSFNAVRTAWSSDSRSKGFSRLEWLMSEDAPGVLSVVVDMCITFVAVPVGNKRRALANARSC